MVEEYILYQIEASGESGIPLSALGNRIRLKFADFKVRDYGYSQFKQYIKSFPDVDLKDDGEQKWAVLVGRG